MPIALYLDSKIAQVRLYCVRIRPYKLVMLKSRRDQQHLQALMNEVYIQVHSISSTRLELSSDLHDKTVEVLEELEEIAAEWGTRFKSEVSY